MANPTTNFGWVMPTSADLVTDLPADFAVFGQGVDTSMQYLLGGTTGQVLSKTSATNMAFTWTTPTDQTPLTTKGDLFTFTTVDARLAVGTNKYVLGADSAQATGLAWQTSPQSVMTATGDIMYASAANTPARLGIGSASQVLAVSGGIPAWTTPSSGALTLVTRSTFSNVASVTIDSIFTSTYKTYLVVIEHIYGNTSNVQDLGMQFRYGSVTQASAYYSAAVFWASGTSATANNVGGANTAYCKLNASLGGADSTGTIASLTIGNVGQGSEYALYYGAGTDFNDLAAYVYAGQSTTARTYTGLVFLPDSGNITGEISIYGLATA